MAFIILGAFYFHFYLRAAQVLVLWMTAAAFQGYLKVQSSKLNTKKSMYGTGTAITRGTDQGQRCSIDLLVNAFHF